MSLALNTDNPRKLFTPTLENLMRFCVVPSSAGPNRFILHATHYEVVAAYGPFAGERICLRCHRLMREVEQFLEELERKEAEARIGLSVKETVTANG